MRETLFIVILVTEAEALDQVLVTVEVLTAEVAEKLAALADKVQKASLGMVVVDMFLKVLGKITDSLSENGDLDLGGAGVGRMDTVLFDDISFDVFL